MKDNHIELIRLRLFTANEQQAKTDPYNYGHTLNLALKLARRIKAQGLQIMLDFHYSDTWADPGHQSKPNTWANLTFDQLVATLHDYTRESLRAFVEAKSIPEYVQIGNEITHGMLWPDGRLNNDSDWPRLAALLQAASRAVREVVGQKTKIIIHSTASTRWAHAQWYFNKVIADIDFDIIGLSYYPFWHGKLDALHFCLEQLSRHYDKSIFIVETAYPWDTDPSSKQSMKNVTGFEESPEGQMLYITSIADMLRDLPGKKREFGLVWWAAEYVTLKSFTNLAGFDKNSFFNSNGTALPILRTFGQLSNPVTINDGIWGHAYCWSFVYILTLTGILL
ncbi:unnamed protein product, partial [Rotaria sp. Silwood2]